MFDVDILQRIQSLLYPVQAGYRSASFGQMGTNTAQVYHVLHVGSFNGFRIIFSKLIIKIVVYAILRRHHCIKGIGAGKSLL